MTWPISNRSNSLQVDYNYLRRQVGKYLKYGYNHATWDDEQNQAVDEVIDEGCRLYYFPPILTAPYGMGIETPHQWSFMRPRFEITTQANQRRYPLPDDWERPISDLCYPDRDNSFHVPIQWTSAARLMSLEYQDNFTSYPQWGAVEPGAADGIAPQTQVLVLHPTPDSTHVLSAQYQAHARRLTIDQPHPLGGQPHSQGILAAVLAVAEARVQGDEGPLWRRFMERLAGNIVRDRERGARILGYNGNGGGMSNSRSRLRDSRNIFYSDTTYAGGSYDGE